MSQDKIQSHGNCKMCGQWKKFGKSHIIPLSFYNQFIEKGVRLYSTDEGIDSKQVNGKFIYDSEMLCHDCERTFQPYDNYAPDLFKLLATPSGPHDDCLNLNVNYKLLKLLFMSIMWRAHAATIAHYSESKIYQPIAQRLLDMIQRGDPGTADDFSLELVKYNVDDEHSASLRPEIEYHQGVKTVRFFINGLMWRIKIENKPYVNQIVRTLVLRPNEPFKVTLGKWKKSRMRRLIVETVAKCNE